MGSQRAVIKDTVVDGAPNRGDRPRFMLIKQSFSRMWGEGGYGEGRFIDSGPNVMVFIGNA